jgi:chemotaxis protein methyltransferase CheR
MSRTTTPFDQLLAHLETDLGFESSHYNDAYLERRIAARMRRVDTDEYETYTERLRTDPEERKALLDSLSINVTGFFRNPAVWEELRTVLRAISENPGPTRVWSAPCADGREPYSLAMLALDDPEISSRKFEVLATDISEPALDVARAGVYSASRTRDIEGELSLLSEYEPYLEREENRFTVRDRVKEHVRFERHDLLRDEPKSGIDLALCRNLLIYIDTAYKATVVDTVLDSLSPDGYLAIGKTETVPRTCADRLSAVDNRLRIYRLG